MGLIEELAAENDHIAGVAEAALTIESQLRPVKSFQRDAGQARRKGLAREDFAVSGWASARDLDALHALPRVMAVGIVVSDVSDQDLRPVIFVDVRTIRRDADAGAERWREGFADVVDLDGRDYEVIALPPTLPLGGPGAAVDAGALLGTLGAPHQHRRRRRGVAHGGPRRSEHGRADV